MLGMTPRLSLRVPACKTNRGEPRIESTSTHPPGDIYHEDIHTKRASAMKNTMSNKIKRSHIVEAGASVGAGRTAAWVAKEEQVQLNDLPPKAQRSSKPRFLPFLTRKLSRSRNQAFPNSEASKPTSVVRDFDQTPTSAPSSGQETQETPAEPTLLLSLPLEIWHLITSDLPQTTIAVLILSHPSLYNVLTPLLYHTIDLSLSFAISTRFSIPAVDPASRLSQRSHVAKSQYLFVQQILAHPHLGFHVRNLRWSLGLERMGVLPEKIQDKAVVWKEQDLFDMFAMLGNVVKVDFGTGTRGQAPLLPTIAGKHLFRNAIYVRLSGTLRREFVEAVLLRRHELEIDEGRKGKEKDSMKMSQLKSLVIDDVEEETVSAPDLVTGNVAGASRTTQDVLTIGFCQPMQHILTPSLFDRCRNPKLLSIRVYSLSNRGSVDDALWTEWAIFIQNVQPREVIFDCDRRLKRHGRGGGSALRFSRLREQRGRAAIANDRRFGETLLPILKNCWDSLKRLEIRGVSHSVVQELKALEEKGVEVVIDDLENEAGSRFLGA